MVSTKVGNHSMSVIKGSVVAPNSSTSPLLYVEDKQNDLFRYTIMGLREVYLSQDLEEYGVRDIEKARVQLVKLKSKTMRVYDWKYHTDIKYLFERMQNPKRPKIVENLFKLLQRSYRAILTNDDTEDLENAHVALVQAVHEWAYSYTFEDEQIKKEYAPTWKQVIVDIANSLQRVLRNFTRQEYQTAEVETIRFTRKSPFMRPAELA